MKRLFQIFAYAFLIVAGTGLFSFMYDNHVIKLNIANDSVQSLIGVILFSIGVFALNESVHKANLSRRLVVRLMLLNRSVLADS